MVARPADRGLETVERIRDGDVVDPGPRRDHIILGAEGLLVEERRPEPQDVLVAVREATVPLSRQEAAVARLLRQRHVVVPAGVEPPGSAHLLRARTTERRPNPEEWR